MRKLRDWEIPPWEPQTDLDQSDFIKHRDDDREFAPPVWLWIEEVWGSPIVRLSNTCDACEAIDLDSAQDIDDLVARLVRAKADVFGKQ